MAGVCSGHCQSVCRTSLLLLPCSVYWLPLVTPKPRPFLLSPVLCTGCREGSTIWWYVLSLLPGVQVLHTCIASTQQQCFWQKVRACSSRVAVSAQHPALSLHTPTTHPVCSLPHAHSYQVICMRLNNKLEIGHSACGGKIETNE